MSALPPFFVPDYVDKFQCLGSTCPDTCCSGWNVALDEKTYKAYRSISTGNGHLNLRSNITPTPPRDRSQSNYGQIKMKSDRQCPFLSEKQLCEIQERFGQHMLSNTCAKYPRSTLVINGMGQRTLTPSCPEAARLMLANRDAISIRVKSLNPDVYANSAAGYRNFDSLSANELRFTLINLVQMNGFELWQRLVAVGLICSALDECSDDHSALELAKSLLREDAVNQFIDVAGKFHGVAGAQAKIFSSLFTLKKIGKLSSFQQSVWDDISQFFSTPNSSDISSEAVVQRYYSGIEHLDRLLFEKEYLLVNFIANTMFASGFPLSIQRVSAKNEFFEILAKVGVLRFMLVARAWAKRREFREAHFIETVSVFSRLFEHNATFKGTVKKVFTSLQTQGTMSLALMVAFIKDQNISSNNGNVPIACEPSAEVT